MFTKEVNYRCALKQEIHGINSVQKGLSPSRIFSKDLKFKIIHKTIMLSVTVYGFEKGFIAIWLKLKVRTR